MARNSNGLTPPATSYPVPQRTGNPFLNATADLDQQTGAFIRLLGRQQHLNMVLGVAVLVLVAYAVFAPGKVKYLPYVAEVAHSGEIRTVGILPHAWRGETTKPIDFVVREWLTAVREIPDSKVVWGLQWKKANTFLTVKGQQMITEYALGRDVKQKRGETIQLEITSVLPVTPDFQAVSAEWIERTYSQQGMLISTENYKAMLTVGIFPPTELKNDAQFRNSLGLFILSWSWAPKTTKGAAN